MGGGEVLGSDGTKGGWDFGRRAETDRATLAVLFVSRGSRGCSTSSIWERAGLNTFCSAHIVILCPSGFKTGNGLAPLIFPRVSSSSSASSCCSYPARTPMAQGRKCLTAASWESSAFWFFFFSATWILPTTPTHAQDPHCILYSAQHVPTQILHSQRIKLLKMMTFCYKDTLICNKVGKLNKYNTPYANYSSTTNEYFERKCHHAVPLSS